MSERKSKKKTGPRPAGNGGGRRSSPAGDGGPMDVALLQQIVKLMAANDLNTVDLRDGGRRVVLKRGAPVVAMQPGVAPVPQAQQSPASQQQAAPPASQQPGASEDDTKGLIPIKSPM